MGRTALVTGASRRIGRAVALRLAADGADVAVHYGANERAADKTVARIAEAGGRAFPVRARFGEDGALDRDRRRGTNRWIDTGMRFGIFGHTRAWREDGTEITLGGPARRALLLVRPGEVVPTDRLADEIDLAETSSAHALQSRVSRLRAALASGVAIERAGVAATGGGRPAVIALTDEALTLTWQLGALEDSADLLVNRGDHHLDDTAAARADYTAAADLAHRAGSPTCLADIALLAGDRPEAERLYEDALERLDPHPGGLRSATRRLTFGPDERFVKHLDVYCAIFTTANHLDLDHTGHVHRTAGKLVAMYSARHNTEAKAVFYFASPQLDLDRRDVARQQAVLAEHFAGTGWQSDRLLHDMRSAPDFYFDAVTQVRQPQP